jgi:hypothetical protein
MNFQELRAYLAKDYLNSNQELPQDFIEVDPDVEVPLEELQFEPVNQMVGSKITDIIDNYEDSNQKT